MIEVGPYAYTNKDARKTFASLGHLWDELVRGRDATSAEDDGRQLVARLVAALGRTVDGVEHLDAEAHRAGPRMRSGRRPQRRSGSPGGVRAR